VYHLHVYIEKRKMPAVLTAWEEEIIRTVAYYRYMTARDLTNLLVAKTSITWMRGLLADLSGKDDLQTHHYLCRFTLPSHGATRERVYVLGAKGRRLLQEQGIPVSWYFRPNRLKFLSYSYVIHNLILTRAMIAAAVWTKDHPTYFLTEKRICYELAGKVVPDAWLCFEDYTDEGVYQKPVLFEIDRGMENKDQFRAHVRGRINYLQSGEYKRTFYTDYATVAYATTGQTEAYRNTRRKAMCTWIMELLREMRMTEWAGVFRVASIEFANLYDNALFESEVWYRPDSEKAVRLFE
jgi:hypothetical protein